LRNLDDGIAKGLVYAPTDFFLLAPLCRSEQGSKEMDRRGAAKMASIDEELEAAQAAKIAVYRLSPNIGAMIRKARDVAAHSVTNLPSDWRLDDARCIVVGALSDLIDAPEDAPLEEKIDGAKAAIEEWIECLE
jgi:hypothetical protein